MVARINVGTNIKGMLNYNEHKIRNGMAACIGGEGFGTDVGDLHFLGKLNRFEKLIFLNARAKTNAVHISLNFHPDEKIDLSTMLQISSRYMDGIGFGNQPYLVYQHFDAGHPHMHIVTTNICQDGTRINTHNIGKNQSEKVRQEIECEFALIKANQSKSESKVLLDHAIKVVYGKTPTKEGLSNVIRMVVRQYKYTSLAELNAILKQFNVLADRGEAGTSLHERRGLVYRVLDSKSKKIGVAIKASSIAGKPTLKFLERQFVLNRTLRQSMEDVVRKKVQDSMNKSNNIADLATQLEKQNIFTVMRTNKEGRIYGVTFVDNSLKVVFNGSDLGKSFSIAAIQKKFDKHETQPAIQFEKLSEKMTGNNPLDKLLSPEFVYEFLSAGLLFRRRRRKRKGMKR